MIVATSTGAAVLATVIVGLVFCILAGCVAEMADHARQLAQEDERWD